MRRILPIGILATALGITAVSACDAQVFVRAPFVRVQVGPGVSVEAPFFRFYAPPVGPVYIADPGYVYPPGYVLPQPSPYIPPLPRVEATPRVDVAPPASTATPPASPAINVGPPPAPVDGLANGTVAQAGATMTLEQFAKTFQPRAGIYAVSVVNPVTQTPTLVRFTLPEGSPRRVRLNDREIEFHYGLRHFVRIEFDRDGAQVISR